ncbi:hypothetical protein CC78DRAFT_89063 [Lojkania enalia]|uniref:DUF7730 domain-containing protein n=1 Tax=Lojkania enalia TaxID=147567 RepID=A0A9P4JXF7_9PLEO|nr:hypothetical protein CC78DRAFT_89063 [Didymosphaeria enalia]
MPPSQNKTPSTRDITKAFFNLNLYGSKSTDRTRSTKPRNLHYPATSKSCCSNEAKDNSKITFLTLPTEIRLNIYELLLVSRSDLPEHPSRAVENTNQKTITLDLVLGPQYKTMTPAILRTCRQIYCEANEVLYAQNVFAISGPKQMFRLIAQIGTANLTLIRVLDIWVPWIAELSSWLQLLHVLADEASGLRCLRIGFGAEFEYPRQLARGARERGMGDDLDFVRALGDLRQLEEIVLEGYYAKRWPAYLEDTTGAHVRALCGHWIEVPESTEGGVDLGDQKFVNNINKIELENFGRYQEGTEDLIP